MAAVRYDVTPYSYMHLGHAWCAYHAWREARLTGAEFLMQFDDQGYWEHCIWWQSFELSRGCDLFREDLEWLGLAADRYELVTQHRQAYEEAAQQVGMRIPSIVEFEGIVHHPVAANSQMPGTLPWSALVHVVCDRENGVECFVRGNEFIQQHDLYAYFWRKLAPGIPPVAKYARLVWRAGGAQKISKNMDGGVGVRDLREAGWTAAEVLDSLRECDRREELLSGRITIPSGVLVPDGEALEYLFAKVLKTASAQAKGFPWQSDVAAAVRERSRGPEHADRNQR